jgi:hypothetical protein
METTMKVPVGWLAKIVKARATAILKKRPKRKARAQGKTKRARKRSK